MLRVKHPANELVFIIGGELTIDMNCFIAGESIHARIANLAKPLFFIKNALGFKPRYQKSFNQFLRDAVSIVKKEFSGKVAYASAMWEKVDWSDFDFYTQRQTYSSNPDNDYDMASFSITKSLGNNNWKPKESFYKIADYYNIQCL